MLAVTQIRNIRIVILLMRTVRVDEYVKGAEPDRWHWYKSCIQYPRVIIQKRASRPTHDLCDDCLEIEKKMLRKIPAT